MGSSISTPWRKLSGENNWEGLLQPLDHDLRKYLIHYGQMTGAVGDLLNTTTDEPDASKEDFFSKACLVKGNPYKYDVTRFIYGGSDDVEPSWFAYVAVATDEGKRALGRRDVLVAWRGTSSTSEWLNDFNFIIQRNASDIFPTAKQHDATVHRGFHDLYTEQDRILLVPKLVPETSLGAAIATLTAMDIVANGYNKPTAGCHPDKSFMVTAITFGSHRVGNTGLANLFDSLRDYLHLLRVENNSDECEPNSKRSRRDIGSSVEDELSLKFKPVNLGVLTGLYSCHNMDVYAHGVAIKDIGEKTPAEKLDHDLALVNKYLDRASNEYSIPSNWWAGDNRKRLAQLENGRWKVHAWLG
ncbi:hypothetical protein V6N13_004079 [Hibiscus sabdariffa]|uniref:Phospholipase A1 n=1 Tax=Hibiscus sabdariffa TaxID=183260 RepID=A0ABR2RYA0_9ROSI